MAWEAEVLKMLRAGSIARFSAHWRDSMVFIAQDFINQTIKTNQTLRVCHFTQFRDTRIMRGRQRRSFHRARAKYPSRIPVPSPNAESTESINDAYPMSALKRRRQTVCPRIRVQSSKEYRDTVQCLVNHVERPPARCPDMRTK